MPSTVTFHGSSEQVRLILRQLVDGVTGHAPDKFGVVMGLQMRIANVLLSKVQQAFLVKARGGVGEDGVSWPPLKRSTIAQRRTTAEERRAAGVGGQRVRGLLTPAQDKRWRQIFGTRKAMLMVKFGMSDRAASARAAQIAWATLKGEGAKTKLMVFGGRTVETLRDTGELFRTLTPGVEEMPSNVEGQIVRTFQGHVTIGTNKKPWHHLGIPGRLPSRPYWPLSGVLPEVWWDAIREELSKGMAKALVMILARG